MTVTVASQAKLAGEIATYTSLPSLNARQAAALATDRATYAKQAAILAAGPGAPAASSLQTGEPSAGLPSGLPSLASLSASTGTSPSVLLLLGVGLLLLVVLVRRR